MIRCATAALLAAFGASAARAQAPTPAPAQPPASPDAPPAFERPNGTLLRPGRFVYQLTLRRDTLVRDLGTRSVDVSETTLSGVPVWLVAESRVGTPVPTSDSLYLTRVDLSPARWVAASGAARLAASFTRDSMYGAMQSYQGRASFIAPLPAGALLTPGMVDRLVELLPLQAGYHTGASVVLVDLGTPRAVPAAIAVEREEPVALPENKTVDSWVVRLTAGSSEERLWVSKDSPRVVKTEQVTPAGTLTALLQRAPVVVAEPSLADLFPGGQPIIVPGSRPIVLTGDRQVLPPPPAVRPTPSRPPARPR